MTIISNKNSKENQQIGEVVIKFGNLWQKGNLKQGSSCSLCNIWQGKNSKCLLTEEQFPLFWTNCIPVVLLGQKAKLMKVCTVLDLLDFHSFSKHSVMLRMLNWVRRWNSSLQAKTSEEPVCCSQHHSRLAFPPTTSLQLFSYFTNLRSMSLNPQLPEMQPIHFYLNLLIEFYI